MATTRARFRATSGQERLWLLHQLDPTDPCFHLTVRVWLRDNLTTEQVVTAWTELARRHEAMRSRFVHDAGALFVEVSDEPPPVAVYSVDGEAAARALAGRLAREPFDLGIAAHRFACIRFGPRAHIALTTAHHVLRDGASGAIESLDLLRLFHHALGGPSLSGPAVPFSQRASWERERDAHADTTARVARLAERLAAFSPIQLPLASGTPGARGGSSTAVEPVRIGEIARGLGVRPFRLVLAAWAAVAARLEGSERLVIPIASADRRGRQWDTMAGFTTNLVPVPLEIEGDPTLADLVAMVDRATDAALRTQVPAALLARALRSHGVEPEPLLTTGQVVMESWNLGTMPLGDGTVDFECDRQDATLHGTASSDLVWLFRLDGEGVLAGELVARDAALAPEARGDLARWFAHTLRAFGTAPDARLRSFDWCDPAERERAVALGAGHDFSRRDGTLLDDITAQMRRTPDAVALEGEEPWTYRALEERAARFAGRLTAEGVRRGDLVALALPLSAELAAALLGVWWAGAAFTILDPREPTARRAQILEDADPVLVVVAPGRATGELRWREVELEAGAPVPRVEPTEDELAYVLFTSGSTGRPKGARNLHRGIASVVRQFAALPLEVDGPARTLWRTAPTFDPFLLELLGPLVTGGTVIVAPRGLELDPAAFAAFLDEARVESFGVTPSLLARLIPGLATRPARSLRRVVAIGEPLTDGLVEQLRAVTDAVLVNGYGPVEAAVYVSFEVVEPGRRVTIGRPLDGVRLAVIDAAGRPLPVGVAGELRISGVQVGDGYHRRPELTAERFDDDAEVAGARSYRTGDVARLLPDGRFDFLGRVDDQVKLRGIRVEPGEVRAALVASGAADAFVLARAMKHGLSLVAWVVGGPAPEILVERMRARVPPAMVPARVVRCDALPTNASGKVDRRRLPDPDLDAHAHGAPARAGTEAIIAEVFADIAGRNAVGGDESFFDIGGDSLSALDAAQVLAEHGIEVTLPLLFSAPTPRALAAAIGATPVRAPMVRAEGWSPASVRTARLVAIADRNPRACADQVSVVLELRGELDRRAFEAALRDTVEAHEALRLRMRGSEPLLLDAAEPFAVPLRDVPDLSAEILRDADEPFDVLTGPRIRASLSQPEPMLHELLLTTHHSVCDGWSARPLIRTLFEAYAARREGRVRPPDRSDISFRDWARWQCLDHDSDAGRARLARAVDRVASHPAVSRSAARDGFEPRRTSRVLPAAVRARVAACAQRARTTPLSVYTAAFARALAAVEGNDDVLFGVLHGNRDHPGLMDTVGYFVDHHYLRLRGEVSTESARDALMAARQAPVSVDALVRCLRPDCWDRVWVPARWLLNVLPRPPGRSSVAGLDVTIRDDRIPSPRFQYPDGMLYLTPDGATVVLIWGAMRVTPEEASGLVDGFAAALEEVTL